MTLVESLCIVKELITNYFIGLPAVLLLLFKSKSFVKTPRFKYWWDWIETDIKESGLNFIRTIDTSALQNSAQAIKDFTTLYHTFCSKVGNHITPFDKQIPSLQDDEQPKTEELVFSPVKYFLKEGLQVCRSMGARLPEIRNRDSYNEIRFTAIKKAIKKFRAGVYYDTGTTTFRYYYIRVIVSLCKQEN